MDIKTLLANYWSYGTTGALALWNIFLHFKSNKQEKKKNLQTTYLELTSVINEFQVGVLKNILIETEVMKLKIEVSEDIELAKEVLKNVNTEKRTEIVTKKDSLVQSTEDLLESFKNETNETSKERIRGQMKEKSIEILKLLAEFEEENKKNKPVLDSATEIQKIAANKLSVFYNNMPQKIITLSTIINDFINKLNTSASWQLSSSKTVKKIVQDLESFCMKLNTYLLSNITKNPESIQIDVIVKSAEFKNTWELAEKAISQMRKEL